MILSVSRHSGIMKTKSIISSMLTCYPVPNSLAILSLRMLDGVRISVWSRIWFNSHPKEPVVKYIIVSPSNRAKCSKVQTENLKDLEK